MLEELEKNLQNEVDCLELRNLEVIKAIHKSQQHELQAAQKIISVPGHHHLIEKVTSTTNFSAENKVSFVRLWY